MAEKKDTFLNNILIFILIVKVLWILSLFSHFIIKKYFSEYHHYIKIINDLEYLLHDLFTVSIGILLIYLYHSFTTKSVCIEGHTKLYLFSFGVLSMVGTLQKIIHKYYIKDFREESEEIERFREELEKIEHIR